MEKHIHSKSCRPRWVADIASAGLEMGMIRALRRAALLAAMAFLLGPVQAGLAQDIEVGEILAAPYTDAPWTPLFIAAGGVVVETGGIISHAATVAREFGIPCVVLVHDATRIIREGDLLRVDGAAGTVTVVERA